MLYYSFSIAHHGEAVPNSAVVVVVACFRALHSSGSYRTISLLFSPSLVRVTISVPKSFFLFPVSEILTSNLSYYISLFHILPLAYVRARALSLSLSLSD